MKSEDEKDVQERLARLAKALGKASIESGFAVSIEFKRLVELPQPAPDMNGMMNTFIDMAKQQQALCQFPALADAGLTAGEQ